MLPNFIFCCSEVLEKWVKLTAANGSCELDVFSELQTLSDCVISKMLFGKNQEEGKRLFEIQKEQAEMAFQGLWKMQLPGLGSESFSSDFFFFLPSSSSGMSRFVPLS